MSRLRITGLATGMDTDQMIKDLMKVERTRVDRVKQDKQILEWRRELYNSINKDFANFILNTKKEFGLTGTTSTGSMFNQSLSSLNWVKRAVSSNENAIKASTTAQAINGSYDVTVHRLADGVKGASSENIDGDIKAFLSGLGEETLKFKINTGETITINSSDTMSTIVKKINSSGSGVQASYDSSIGRLFLQTTGTGKEATLNITDVNGSTDFINALSLKVTSYDNEGNLISETEEDNRMLKVNTLYNGVDAKITFNGAENITKSSNQFTINGINLDLKTTGSTTIKVDTDTDAVYDKIKGFVDKYNEIVDKMGKLLGEKEYRSFRPLTEEQKEAMKEKEIELWEEKAKSGLLRNDSIISSTMQKVRSSLYENVEGIEGPFKALFDIGITTEKWAAGTVGGRLEINSDRLKKAITEDVNGVLDLLFKEAGTITVTDAEGNTETKQGKGGVITRMYDLMIDGMKEVINKAGPGEDTGLFRNIRSNMLIDFVTEYGSISMLDKDISKLDLRVDDLNRYLVSKEDQYYKQFAAMEKYIQQMNSQGSWMMQQLGM